MTNDIEIISVGNELLIGKTLNTNAQWLAKRLTALGLSVSRITTIKDEVPEIVKAVKETMLRKPRFIITTGGLGPTFDDKTLEGIAKACDSTLQINEDALQMVTGKYVKYAEEMKHEAFELTPARRKMAKIPEGATPLPNPVGTAPAVLLTHKTLTLFALPGVPSEMKAIFTASLLPIFKEAASDLTFFETSMCVEGVMESEIAPFLAQVMHRNPYIYIKSHPLGAEKTPKIELHLSTTAQDVTTAKKRVSQALIQLSEIVEAKGGTAQIVK